MSVSLRLAVFALLANLPVAWAQAGSADLVGEVSDASAAVIAKAQVAATKVAATTETTSAGLYLFRNLRPWQLSRDGRGARLSQGNRREPDAFTGQTARLDFKLEVGSTKEAIEVHGSEQLLNTENGSPGQVIASKSVINLPRSST